MESHPFSRKTCNPASTFTSFGFGSTPPNTVLSTPASERIFYVYLNRSCLLKYVVCSSLCAFSLHGSPRYVS